MDTERFLTLVAELGETDRDGAERATAAVLTTLGEHLTRGEAADVVGLLPPELQGYLFSPGSPQGFGVEEFVRRVAEREGTDPAVAETHAAAVFTVLHQAIGDKEFDDLSAQLGRHYQPLLTGRSALDPADAFVGRVAQRAGTDVDQAWRVTTAVLETLAQRIARGDVDDLAAFLPLRLHEPLHRGAAEPDPRMDAAGFARRVAERAGIDLEQAVHRIPAVFAVLRSDVGDEFFDVTVQLPEQYRPLLGTQPAR